MRVQREDDDDVRMLLVHGSWSWTGPSPRADQARWAAGAAPHRARRVLRFAGSVTAAAAFTALVFGVTLFAASGSQGGAANGVTRLMSHVFSGASGSLGGTPAAPASAAPGPDTTGSLAATPRAARPTPARSSEPDDRRPSPAASGSPLPSPSPSRPPDK